MKLAADTANKKGTKTSNGFNKKDYIISSTSGSTGEPFDFYVHKKKEGIAFPLSD